MTITFKKYQRSNFEATANSRDCENLMYIHRKIIELLKANKNEISSSFFSFKRIFIGLYSPVYRIANKALFVEDLRRKLANYNTLHFRSFLAKSNDSILHKGLKPLFLGLLGTFCLLLFAFCRGSKN